MQTATHSHRFIVALPLMVLIVTLTIVEGLYPAVASVSNVTSVSALEGVPLDTIIGSSIARLEPGANLVSLEDGSMVLTHGSALVLSQSSIRLVTDGILLQSFGGGFRIVRGGSDTLTIAAISAPVLVTVGSGHMLLPIGTQWRVTETQTTVDQPSAWITAHMPKRLPEEYLLAELRLIDDLTEQFVVGSDDIVEPPMKPTDRWLLSSLHPVLWDSAWVMQRPEATTSEDRLLRLVMLPIADVQAQAASVIAVREWQKEWESVLSSTSLPAEILRPALSHLRAQVTRMEEKGLPERAGRYREAILAFATPYESLLTDEEKALLQSFSTASDIDRETSTSSDSSVSPAASSSAPEATPLPIENQIVIQRDLESRGFMFTTKSFIGAVPGGFRIENAIFASTGGDTTISFTLNEAASDVAEIVRAGQKLPFAVPFEQFMEWLQR